MDLWQRTYDCFQKDQNSKQGLNKTHAKGTWCKEQGPNLGTGKCTRRIPEFSIRQLGPVIALSHQASHFTQHPVSVPDGQLCHGQNIHRSVNGIFMILCLKNAKRKELCLVPWLSGYRGKWSYLAKGTSASHHEVLEQCHHRHVNTPRMPCSLPLCHSMAHSSRDYNPWPSAPVAFIKHCSRECVEDWGRPNHGSSEVD